MFEFVLSATWSLIALLAVVIGAHAHVCCYGWPFADRFGIFPPCHPTRIAQLQLEQDLIASRTKKT
jgi:hypothetical protein